LLAKDRATLHAVRGFIVVRPSGVAGSGMMAIGVKLDVAFDPMTQPDYVNEGDVFWSAPWSFGATSTEPIVYELNLKSRRVLSSAAADAVELVTNSSVAGGPIISVALHALLNRA